MIMAPVILGAGLAIGGVSQVVRAESVVPVLGGLAATVIGLLACGAALAHLARPTRR
jgi:hypothetical protein